MKDFQIVNGGQTTASIFHAKRYGKADISDVWVQVKLSVVSNPAELDEFVGNIAKLCQQPEQNQRRRFFGELAVSPSGSRVFRARFGRPPQAAPKHRRAGSTNARAANTPMPPKAPGRPRM